MRGLLLFLALGCRPDLPEPPEDADSTFLRGRFSGILGAGIEDASVCAAGPSACTRTDRAGQFLLEGLPRGSDVTILVDAEGHVANALPYHTDELLDWDKVLLGEGLLETIADRVGEVIDPDLGHFAFTVHDAHFREGRVGQVADVAFALEPAPDTPLYYLTFPFLQASADLEATTVAGGGGGVNLAPGRYEVTFSGPIGACRRILSWDFAPGDPVPIEILPGRSTYVDVLCPPESD